MTTSLSVFSVRAAGLLVGLTLVMTPLVGRAAPAAPPSGASPSGASATNLPSEAETPAQGDPEPSIWAYIEGAEGAPPTPATLAATEELVEERTAELGRLGQVGASAPVDYYLDPVRATEGDPLHLERVNPKEFDIPIVVNDEVIGWMRYFLGSGRKYYTRYLERSTRWMPLMHQELGARGLPKDLVYLSMIESGFSTGATSYVSAAGLWQFMSYTGRDYGLRIDWWVDDRRDPEASTKAALRYLGDLHRMFAGDWQLAWASYNGGQGRVMRATRAAGSTDFWTLARGSYLHSETDNYVPKLIAAAIIGKHPERYGFVGIKYQPAFTFDAVTVPASTNVAALAKCAGLTQEAFLEYNPALRRFALPPDPATQRIRIPAGMTAAFNDALAKVPAEDRITRLQRHVVKRGQSLASIARSYKVDLAELARANHITTKSRLRVGTELVIPVAGSVADEVGAAPASSKGTAPAATSSTPATASAKTSKRAAPATHVVKPGDTLGAIATRYGATQKELQAWNGLKSTTVKVGQKLVVSAPAASTAVTSAPAPVAAPASKPGAAARTGKTVRYTVRRGDTLASIADTYDCSIAEIKAWNGLKGSTIYVGQKLKIKD